MTGSDQIGDRDALRAAFMPLWQSNVSADMAFAWVEAQIRAALVAERALSDTLAAALDEMRENSSQTMAGWCGSPNGKEAFADSRNDAAGALAAWRVARGGQQ